MLCFFCCFLNRLQNYQENISATILKNREMFPLSFRRRSVAGGGSAIILKYVSCISSVAKHGSIRIPLITIC